MEDVAKSTTSAAGASSILDMALDDVIMQKRREKPRRSRNSPQKGSSQGRHGSVQGRNGRRSFRPANSANVNVHVRSVQSGRVIVRSRAALDQPQRSRGNINGAWLHDRYEQAGSGGRRFVQRGGSQETSPMMMAEEGGSASRAPTRVQITNLYHEVTSDDLKQLFASCGTISNVRMQYDRAGRSNGIADVFFVSRRDAQAAVERFHNVPLDGLPMQLEISSSALPLQTNRAQSSDNRSEGGRGHSVQSFRRRANGSDTSRRTGGGRHSSSASAGGNGRSRGARAPAKSEDELNAEMDAYMMSATSAGETMQN